MGIKEVAKMWSVSVDFVKKHLPEEDYEPERLRMFCLKNGLPFVRKFKVIALGRSLPSHPDIIWVSKQEDLIEECDGDTACVITDELSVAATVQELHPHIRVLFINSASHMTWEDALAIGEEWLL
jgi:hypothetical protein